MVSVKIFNLRGYKVKDFGNIEYPQDFSLDLEDLKQGIFFLTIDGKSDKIVKKFMKN